MSWQTEGKLHGIDPIEPIKLADLVECECCGTGITPDGTHRRGTRFYCAFCARDVDLAKSLSEPRNPR